MDLKARELFSASNWPSFFELRTGGSINLERKGRAWAIKLISVRACQAQDWRPAAMPGNFMLREAKVMLEVDGKQLLLRLAPFEVPVAFEGLRLQAEMVKALSSIDASSKEPLHYDVRLAAVEEDAPWAPLSFRFPTPGYVWRANPCYGAWSSLLFGDSSRYCDGFNLGVSEEACEVVATLPGTVKSITPQHGAPDLATLCLEHLHGIRTIYGNIDAGSVPFNLSEGSEVDVGEKLGKVSLKLSPPHLRFAFEVEGCRLNPYPALVEAYLRESQEDALPSAGGVFFCHPGERLPLDSSTTILRPGRSIKKACWLLSNGEKREGAQTELKCGEPGFNAEELRILLDNGKEYRDAAVVRVFKPGVKGQPGFPGWLVHSPAAGLEPGAKVSFRFVAPEGFSFSSIDFGDGSSEKSEGPKSYHSYAKPGLYTVEAKGRAPDGEPLSIKRFVKVS